MTTRELLDGDWSYWPDGQYGLLAVTGYGGTGRGKYGGPPAVTLAIVDHALMDRVVVRKTVGTGTLRKVRLDLIREIDALNDAAAA